MKIALIAPANRTGVRSKTDACICQQIFLIAFIVNTIALLILYDMSYSRRQAADLSCSVLS